MSDTENMEKEFTVDELAGGESLVDDEDLTDEEYVEALGEHDEDGKRNASDEVNQQQASSKSPPLSSSVPVEVASEEKESAVEVKCRKMSEEPSKEDKVVEEESLTKKDNIQAVEEAKDNDGKDGADDGDDSDDEEIYVKKASIEADLEEDEKQGEDDQRDEDGEAAENDEFIEDGQDDADCQGSVEMAKQTDKELDDDEDRRNPQYIPKRGAFYEHDDRLGTDEEEDEEEEPEKTETVEKKSEPVAEVRKAKKLWSDDGKWGHDMFDDDEQKPKARDEIVSTYGYDIRNEDGPPKARRHRKYGRGPNRYTRSWKDEGAYSRPNEISSKAKLKPDEAIQRDKAQRPARSKEPTDNRPSDNRRSGSRGLRRNEPRPGNEGIETRKVKEKEVKDSNRQIERKGVEVNNISPGPSKEHREPFNKNDRGDVRRNRKDFDDNDFPELPRRIKEKTIVPQPNHNYLQSVTTGDLSQPNAWNKSRPKHPDVRESIRDMVGEDDYKIEPMRVIESIENGKRPFNLSENSNKIEIVKTQTFENSRYFNRRPLTKGGHHPESSSSVKKDLTSQRSNRGRTRPTDRDFRNSGEIGRPITKTSHLADDYEDKSGSGGGSGSGISGSSSLAVDQQRRNRYNVNKDRGEIRDFRSNHHGLDDRDRRGSEEPKGRNYPDDRHFESHFYDAKQTDLLGALSKLTLDKSSRLSENDSSNLSKPKRYSSLRQHQAQQHHQPQQSEPLSQHQHSQKQHNQPQVSPQQSREPNQQPNSNLTQYPSTQHLNLSHTRQSSNVQYYEAPSGANQQPPSASFYIDNRSPQSTFGYIPTTNIEGAPNTTRFLSQIAPRFIPPPPAPPPTAPEPRFMAQAVAAAAAAANPATAAAAAGAIPSVITGPPTATYLPTYPPGYPQYPPPPPPAAQFSIAPPPPPPPAAPEMYRGGVTYYDTMTQQVSPRQLPQRRPKNALPIVPPPDLNNADASNAGYDVDQNDLNQNVETVSC